MKAPWDYPNLESGGPLVENLPSPEGAALGRELARLADVKEARLISEGQPVPVRCSDCAARLGTIPNQCESTLMCLVKSTIERDPFYCHKGVAEGEEPKRVCGGYSLLEFSDKTETSESQAVK